MTFISQSINAAYSQVRSSYETNIARRLRQKNEISQDVIDPEPIVEDCCPKICGHSKADASDEASRVENDAPATGVIIAVFCGSMFWLGLAMGWALWG